MKYVHVPFQGGAPAITATLGNHVDALVLTLAAGDAAHPERRAARHRRRCRQAQLGHPRRADLRRDGISECVFRFVGRASSRPAKTPDAVVEKLNAEINALMKEPDSLDKLAKAGFDPIGEERRRGQ